jgi:hypothetical protein
MFATSDSTIAQVRERRREARRRELRLLCAQEARIKQRITQIVREADDDGDWRAAGCSSSAQWLAQVCSSDHRTAARITRTSSALRSLPALDHALSTGALTLDQVAAAAEFATPGTDAELARAAVGKAPSAIATCDARRLTIKPSGRDLVHSPVGRCASYAQQRALHKRSSHCQYPSCTATRELEAHHLTPVERGGKTELDNLILLCPPPQTAPRPPHPHQRHLRAAGLRDEAGRAITTNQPHAPPR